MGSARLKLNKVVVSGGRDKSELKQTKYMECLDGGTLDGDKRGFTVSLPAKLLSHKTGSEVIEGHVDISGSLEPVEAYAGIVTYSYHDGFSAKGDMVLVKYTSGIRSY